MRPKKHLFNNTLKVNNLFLTTGFSNDVIDTKVNIVNLFDESSSNTVVNIPITQNSNLIEFNNIAYSNGSIECHIVKGIITNINTYNPTLTINNLFSTTNLINIIGPVKIPNYISIEIENINKKEPPSVNLENVTFAFGGSIYAGVYFYRNAQTTIGIGSDDDGGNLTFYSNNTQIPAPFVSGINNIEFSFEFVDSEQTRWGFGFTSYRLDSINNLLIFPSPIYVKKQQNNIWSTSTLQQFFNVNLFDRHYPFIMNNLVMGGNPGSSLTNITTY